MFQQRLDFYARGTIAAITMARALRTAEHFDRNRRRFLGADVHDEPR